RGVALGEQPPAGDSESHHYDRASDDDRGHSHRLQRFDPPTPERDSSRREIAPLDGLPEAHRAAGEPSEEERERYEAQNPPNRGGRPVGRDGPVARDVPG